MKGRKLMRFSLIAFSMFLAGNIQLKAQCKWDGEGNDGQWNNPANWTGDTLPSGMSSVVLDNSYWNGSYTVELSGPETVTIQYLHIAPGQLNAIRLLIPTSNKTAPALHVDGTGYSITLMNGGIIQNSSGASSGAVIGLADSIQIRNGGHYIHNTSRSHATLVGKLSRAPGTEEGIFEFRIPDASATISLSDRVFGSLMLNADTGTINYTGAGTNGISVRSTLNLGTGVRLNLNFTDTFKVAGDFVMNGSFMNLGSTNRSLTFDLLGHTIINNSIITNTGSATPKIRWVGNLRQRLKVAGSVNETIVLEFANPNGLILEDSMVIRGVATLSSGNIISSMDAPLIIDSSGFLQADSLKTNVFIDGPVVLRSYSNRPHVMIPIGSASELRWTGLKDFIGEVRIQYRASNPQLLSDRMQGVHHISSHGYWELTNLKEGNQFALQLSFNDANQAGITDLSSLAIATLKQGIWNGLSTAGSTGSAGSNGSIISQKLDEDSGTAYFTLASLVASENPLPILDSILRRRYPVERIMGKPTILYGSKERGTVMVMIQSAKRVRMQIVIMNSIGQIIYSGMHDLERGKNRINCFIGNRHVTFIHIFGLFSNHRTNVVTVGN